MQSAAESDDFDVAYDTESHSYEDKVNWDGVVINKRTVRDDGMWDIFNVDKINEDVAAVKTDGQILAIIEGASGQQFSPDNNNVYWNRSVTQTGGFHADTYTDKFKSFVYLTDVPDKSYGPFSYIPRTHEVSTARTTLSKVVNTAKDDPTTDAVFYNVSDAMYYTASKGTLIIANQSGYHRGYPQQEGRERMLLSTAYTPE